MDCGGKQSATPLSNGMRILKVNMSLGDQPLSKAVSKPPHSKAFGVSNGVEWKP